MFIKLGEIDFKIHFKTAEIFLWEQLKLYLLIYFLTLDLFDCWEPE